MSLPYIIFSSSSLKSSVFHLEAAFEIMRTVAKSKSQAANFSSCRSWYPNIRSHHGELKGAGDPGHFTGRRWQYSLNVSCHIQDSSESVVSESELQQIPAPAAPPGSALLGRVPTVSSPVIWHSFSTGTTLEQPRSHTGTELLVFMVFRAELLSLKHCCKEKLWSGHICGCASLVFWKDK